MNVKQSKKVKIGGKERLIKFGTNASAIYCEERDVPLSKYQEHLSYDKMQVGQLRDAIWSGLVSGCISEGKEKDFTKYDVGDWIDDLDQETVESIWKLMNTGGQKAKKKT